MRRLLWILSLIMAFSAALPIMAADLTLPTNPNGNYYNAKGNILTPGSCTVLSGANVKCSTFGEITLNPGFETMANSSFYADINNQDDTDTDGLPDWWEIAFFGNLSQNANGNPDGDGLTNLQEYQGRTDPTVYNSSPPTANLSADPTTVVVGSGTTLSWTTTNATSCTITPGIGNVQLNGSITITPADTTTYTLTATGPGGTATSSVTVTVQFPQPQATLSAQPASIFLGESTTLTWTSQYGQTITITPGVGQVTAANGSVSVSPGQTDPITYTITVINKLYSTSATAQVTVNIVPNLKPGTYYEYDVMGRIKKVIKVIPQ